MNRNEISGKYFSFLSLSLPMPSHDELVAPSASYLSLKDCKVIAAAGLLPWFHDCLGDRLPPLFFFVSFIVPYYSELLCFRMIKGH